MSADRDTTRIVRSWLQTDDHESADRVLQTVLSRLDTTPQRRPLWPTRRVIQMNNVARLAMAAAAVLVIAVIGYNLLPRTAGVGGQGTPAPTVVPSPNSSPIALNGQAVLDGRYVIGSGLKSRVTVTAPAGWSASGDWVLIGPNGNQAPVGMAIRFYNVDNLFKNPRSIAEGVFTPAVGPTAANLADAILGDPAWGATRAPDVTIDGLTARHVQFTIPTNGGLGTDGQFDMFGTAGAVDIWGFRSGQVFDLYMVDVGAERVVIDAFHYVGTPATVLAEQQAVLDGVRFE